MKWLDWHGCYEKRLDGFIDKQAFEHPAKFSLSLIECIYDHMLEQGWLKFGDVVGDPFGGVAIGGLVAAYRRLNWVGCEIEPKFVTLAKLNISLHKIKLDLLSRPQPMIYQGDSRKFAHVVDAVVSSPPYAEGLGHGGGPTTERDQKKGGQSLIGMKAGYSGIVTSPPYSDSLSSGGGNNIDYSKCRDGGKRVTLTREKSGEGYGKESGQIDRLPAGTLSAVVSSPPYASISAGAGGLNHKPAKKEGQQSGRAKESASQSADQKYGRTPGQISHLSGVVTSPPWESNCEGGVRKGKLKSAPPHGKGNYASPKARAAQLERGEGRDYGDTPGNIGNVQTETYWQAMAVVYAQCFQALKPGGYIAIVVKDYVKKRKRVKLCDDTARLLKHVGFRVVERIRCHVVSERTEGDLFVGQVTHRRERKSFFRRLAEAKGSPRIDWEEVIFARKPKSNHANSKRSLR